MAQSFFICAIRETFEEAGVSLAQNAGGQSIKKEMIRLSPGSSRQTYHRRLAAAYTGCQPVSFPASTLRRGRKKLE